jgi:plasmid maintenance system antidote protein VapI
LTFQDAQLRLLAYVRERIHNGELTERGLARSIGISQPHAHNVLKGTRKLSPKISDSILRLFQISMIDLAAIEELEENVLKRRVERQAVQIPFLDAVLGPGRAWRPSINWADRYPLPFPATVAPAGFYMTRLTKDPNMEVTVRDADVALIDTTDLARSEVAPDGLYVIQRAVEVVLRYVRAGANCNYLVSDAVMDLPLYWEEVRSAVQIQGRVIWLGREEYRDLPKDQRGRFLLAMSL